MSQPEFPGRHEFGGDTIHYSTPVLSIQLLPGRLQLGSFQHIPQPQQSQTIHIFSTVTPPLNLIFL